MLAYYSERLPTVEINNAFYRAPKRRQRRRRAAELPRTAALTYLRLRAASYTDEELRSWQARCADFERAFVFFKHEDGAAGPAYAERMLAL